MIKIKKNSLTKMLMKKINNNKTHHNLHLLRIMTTVNNKVKSNKNNYNFQLHQCNKKKKIHLM